MNQTRVKILLHLAAIAWLFSLWQFGNYGNEEDAWTAVATAYQSHTIGHYEISRLPGHPVYEYLLNWLWPIHHWAYSLLSLIATFISFSLVWKIAERYMGKVKAQWTALTFLLTPIVSIMAWQSMEYMLTLAFMLAAWDNAERNKWWYAALFLALATGCRLPTLMYGLPLLILVWQRASIKQALYFGIASFVLSAALFYPPYHQLGWDFFATYELPYPPMLKILYKATLGVYGIFQLLAIVMAKGGLMWHSFLKKVMTKSAVPVALAFLLSIGSYLMIPEKSAFLIPFATIGWFILFNFSNSRFSKAIVVMSVIGALSFGTDLHDENRGIKANQATFTMPIGSQRLAVTLFKGPARASILKSENKMEYTHSLQNTLANLHENALVVTGWWYPFLQVAEIENERIPNYVNYVYYADESTVEDARSAGKSIFFTPESEFYNEQRYSHNLLAQYGVPLEIIPE